MVDVVVLFLLVLLIAGIPFLIWWDARKLGFGKGDGFLMGTSPIGWTLACVMLPIVCVPLYMYARSVAQKRVCPNCAERVKQAAKVCRYCGADLDAA